VTPPVDCAATKGIHSDLLNECQMQIPHKKRKMLIYTVIWSTELTEDQFDGIGDMASFQKVCGKPNNGNRR
jgi:hypothetical protein